MPLNIYTSNRMESLVEALAGVVATPLASPFTPELIVVQSKGMQRWLAMELARRNGVWANCVCPFPNALVWRLFRESLPKLPETSAYDPQVLTWKLMGLLPGFLEREEFIPLRHYLADDRDGLKLFQLAAKIADTLDQYTLFRPELLLAWETTQATGEDAGWQSILWRELAASDDGRHRGRLKEEFRRRIMSGGAVGTGMPERITLFGISYLPQYHLEILTMVSRVTAVNLFLLSPTREYWSDIVSGKALARRTPEERACRMEGNPLLASLGKLGRDFSDLVIEAGDVAALQNELYTEPATTTLLGALQSDILNLRGAGEQEQRLIAPVDLSVQIHSCHSPLREIQVLHDNLLLLLDTQDGLAPLDIVVMTPDIETYAPYIVTVFEGRQDSPIKIPYAIADRNLASEGEIAALLLKLLEIPGSRCTVPQLLDILETPPVRRRFDLSDTDLETIRGWLKETRVRWGLDEKDRERLGLPGYRDHSWRAGIDRLLLGYALPETGKQLFHDMLPYDEMEGADTLSLGKLLEFMGKIGKLATGLTPPRSLSGWGETLRMLLEEFILADDASARERAAITDVISELEKLRESADFTGDPTLGVIRSWLTARLSQEEKGFGFLTGGVTFCAMLPMRSIPFRVVALIGMNDGAFPRQNRPPSFDLITQKPRRGDRSLRDEDRYLFLEAILSARTTLYLSYVGQSIKDNSELPPSVLVSEFLDAITRGFTTAAGNSPAQQLVTQHRLQAFSQEYFTAGSPLFSYSSENCAALLERRMNPWRPSELFTTPLQKPPEEWRELPLPRLLRFFDNPAKFFLEQRLKLRLEEAAGPLEEREPFTVEGLEAYGLNQELLERCMAGEDPEELFPMVRCRGILPPAHHGEALFAAAVTEVTAFAETLRQKIGNGSPLPSISIQEELRGFRVTGSLEQIWPQRMVRYRCATLKAKDQLRAWIEHLFLNLVQPKGYPRETVLFMKKGGPTFRPVDNAAELLAGILALYEKGLYKPLRFFPTSALAYAHKQEWNLGKARSAWEDGYNFPGEGNDPHFQLCFGQVDPFTPEFEEIARTLLEPMLRHQV